MIDKLVDEFKEIASRYFKSKSYPLDWARFETEVEHLRQDYHQQEEERAELEKLANLATINADKRKSKGKK